MKRLLTVATLLVVGLTIAFMAGPVVHFDPVTPRPVALNPDLPAMERELALVEQRANLRPDNAARIVWADSSRKQKTPYSLVYIPGFSASWAEGDPVHRQLARRFGCNLYLARTYGHGVNSPDALRDMTPDRFANSAERALAIGKALGDTVVVIGTSAGGMLTLYLATHHPEIKGLVLYSPCIAVANPALKLATGHWGQQLIERVFPNQHVEVTTYKPDRARYWLTSYHTNGLLTLQTMLETWMTPEQFGRIRQPVFMGYYYKDEDHQDKVVSVPAMLTMFDQLGTPAALKQKQAFPQAGEHVIASHFTSGDLAGVYTATARFMEQVLLMPVTSGSPHPAAAVR